jgi:hypothetical protein
MICVWLRLSPHGYDLLLSDTPRPYTAFVVAALADMSTYIYLAGVAGQDL